MGLVYLFEARRALSAKEADGDCSAYLLILRSPGVSITVQ